MKSLLDIQQDVRKLEKSVQELSKDIKSINSSIDELRNSSEMDSLDFDIIEILSKHFQFNTHPLYRLKDGRHCLIYLELLLNIVRIDKNPENILSRMVFVQWLQKQSLIDWSLEDLYKDTFKQEKEIYGEMVNEIHDKYRDFLVVDALIVGNISGIANREIQEYIVNMATILGINGAKLKCLTLIAKAVLCRDLSDFSREQLECFLDYSKQFKYYLSSDIIDQAIVGLRVVDVELADSEIREFDWEVKNLEYVTAGEKIATFLRKKRNQGGTGYICDKRVASESGVIYQFRYNNTYYGVISHEMDDKESIKEWIRRSER